MENILAIILVIFGVLQIILFFKLWGMTSDIRAIKNKYVITDSNIQIDNRDQIENSSSESNINSDFQIGEMVIDKYTGKKMKITSINYENRTYECHYGGGLMFDGTFKIFNECDIEPLDKL